MSVPAESDPGGLSLTDVELALWRALMLNEHFTRDKGAEKLLSSLNESLAWLTPQARRPIPLDFKIFADGEEVGLIERRYIDDATEFTITFQSGYTAGIGFKLPFDLNAPEFEQMRVSKKGQEAATVTYEPLDEKSPIDRERTLGFEQDFVRTLFDNYELVAYNPS